MYFCLPDRELKWKESEDFLNSYQLVFAWLLKNLWKLRVPRRFCFWIWLHTHSLSACQSESQVNQFLLLLVKVICNQLFELLTCIAQCNSVQFGLDTVVVVVVLVMTLNDVQRAHHQCQAIKIKLKLRNNNSADNNNSNNLDIES